jgi:hypothetical protein
VETGSSVITPNTAATKASAPMLAARRPQCSARTITSTLSSGSGQGKTTFRRLGLGNVNRLY